MQAIAEPFAYDAYRAKRIEQKLEEERKSRISLVKKLPKVGCRGAAWAVFVSASWDECTGVRAHWDERLGLESCIDMLCRG